MKVLNFGSLNLDYVYDVPHVIIPGETLSASRRSIFAGGKGLNQSIAMARAGVEVYHAGCMGLDGDILFETLQQERIDSRYTVSVDVPCGHTIIQVDQKGQNCIIVFGGANRMITKEQVDSTLRGFNQGEIVLLQNEVNEIAYIIDEAYEKGMKIVFNPSPYDSEIVRLPLKKVFLFVINEIEGMQIAGVNSVRDIIPMMARKYSNAKILLTLGEDGAMYFDGNKIYSQPIYSVEVVDTTAAGDTFLGYFIYGFINNLPVEKTMELAAKASAVAVSKKGAAQSIPKMSDIKNWL